MAEKMRVRIELTLEVDAETWGLEYGVEGRREINRDVKSYIRTLIHDASDSLEIAD